MVDLDQIEQVLAGRAPWTDAPRPIVAAMVKELRAARELARHVRGLDNALSADTLIALAAYDWAVKGADDAPTD